MSEPYDTVVVGKLALKGKALAAVGDAKKHKKKHKKRHRWPLARK